MKSKQVVLLAMIMVASIALASLYKPSNSDYSPITENTELTSEQAFHKMMDVLTHQRCMNCHPNDNIPKQGEDSHPHYFGIARGKDDMGFEATTCNTCHHEDNNPYSGVPGAPKWALAPQSMGWEGLNRYQIAESILNPEKNGGRTPEETLHHLTEDELVLWAWNPGVNAEGIPRELPPVPKDEYILAVKKWFKEGHIVPNK